MPQDGPKIRVFTCFSCEWRRLHFHHTCFHVSAVVGRRLPPFHGMVISRILVAFWQDHT